MEVAIRNLKARLSVHLDRVARGEVITVNSRGRRVAQIVPVLGRDSLARGVAEGWSTREVERSPEPDVRLGQAARSLGFVVIGSVDGSPPVPRYTAHTSPAQDRVFQGVDRARTSPVRTPPLPRCD